MLPYFGLADHFGSMGYMVSVMGFKVWSFA